MLLTSVVLGTLGILLGRPSEINRIPKKYMSDEAKKLGPKITSKGVDEASGGGQTEDPSQDQSERILPTYIEDPNVKIKLAKCGLTFSGPTAYLSNLSKSDFTYKYQPYSSSEQGLQHQNALHHKVTDIAQQILDTSDIKIIKDLSHKIPKSEAWNKMSPGILWDITDCKFSQNPPLMKKLLDTAPHRLVEASIDSKWGGGLRLVLTRTTKESSPGKMCLAIWPRPTEIKRLLRKAKSMH